MSGKAGAEGRKTKRGYKFVTFEMASKNDSSCVWKVGEWKECDKPLGLCRSGFHDCDTPLKSLLENVVSLLDPIAVEESDGRKHLVKFGGAIPETQVATRVLKAVETLRSVLKSDAEATHQKSSRDELSKGVPLA